MRLAAVNAAIYEAMDPPMFVPFTPQANGVPLESKLATYMNRQAPPVAINPVNVAKQMSNLSLDNSKKSNINPEFIPENVGGTTYFYVQNHVVDPAIGVVDDGAQIVGSSEPPPLAYVYPGTPSYLQQPMKVTKATSNGVDNNAPAPPQAPSFFIHETLRMEILQKNALTLAQADTVQFPDIPSEVENYADLVPLEMLHKPVSTVLGYQSSTYKATNIKNNTKYCLRRIHEFRLANTKCMVLVDMWKKLAHTNLVQLKEVFTTKAFGDNSIVFVYDYHPSSETMLNRHFSATELNGYSDPFSADPNTPRPYSHTKNTILRHQHSSMLPESIIWSYVIQLTAALRVIHAAGLAYRCLDPTKVLLTSRTRLRLSCSAVPDVVQFDNNSPNPLSLIPHYQQEDLTALGKLVLALACRSLLAVHRDNMQASLELVSRTYSTDLRNLILYLLSNQARRNVTDLMPMIGARFYTQLDAAQLYSDVLENELAKELENGRLFRLIVKLATIIERPELNLDPQWSETGDRYMLKLFRDYVFHQCNATDGRPWLDLAHVVSCLNKLDVGAPDKICLVSRDEQSVLIVSYAELRHCLETSFNELVQSAKGSAIEAV